MYDLGLWLRLGLEDHITCALIVPVCTRTAKPVLHSLRKDHFLMPDQQVRDAKLNTKNTKHIAQCDLWYMLGSVWPSGTEASTPLRHRSATAQGYLSKSALPSLCCGACARGTSSCQPCK